MEEIKRLAVENDAEGAERLQETVVGMIQQEFFDMLDIEMNRVSVFYETLSKNLITELNSILRNRDQWG
jgi:hypothetical protein